MTRTLLLLILFSPFVAFADGMDQPQTRTIGTAPEVGPAPELDQRLPPVIPGQKIKVSGQTMRVFSTSGPVPVGSNVEMPNAPQAPSNGSSSQQGLGNKDISVIIDRRGERTTTKRGETLGDSLDAQGLAVGK